MAQALALTIGSLPLSAFYLRGGNANAPILLVLYVCVAAGMLAWLSLPLIDDLPDAVSLMSQP